MISREDKDMRLVSGCFFEDDIDKNNSWLLKYFKSDIQLRFLKYYLTFGGYYYFRRHTGIFCSTRYLESLKKRLSFLLNMHKEAKSNFDLDLLAKVEMGKIKNLKDI